MLKQLCQGIAGVSFMLAMLWGGLALMPLTACEHDRKARVEVDTKHLGDKAEESTEKMGDAVEDTLDKAGGKLEKAGDKIEDATD